MEYKTNYSSSVKVDAIINFLSEEDSISDHKGVDGKLGKVYTFYTPDLEYAVGIGDGKWHTKIESGIASAIGEVIKNERSNVLVEVPIGLESKIMLAVMKATYRFEKYKTEKSFEISSIYFDFEDEDFYKEEVIVPEMLSEAIAYTKDLQNTNADSMNPSTLAKLAEEMAYSQPRLDVNVMDAEGTFHAISAVGQASSIAPVLIEMAYTGNPDSTDAIVIVGKGVTYDSGGLSLKTSAGMADMKFDMSGAAVSMGVMHDIIADGPNINLKVLIPAAENAIGPDAYKVGDVIETYSGRYVEVKNTDAEGRLILADALSYACNNYNITCMIDIATLTGAVISALGKDIAGVFCNDAGREYLDMLIDSSKSTNEDIWELPITENIVDSLKSKIADISNMSIKKGEHGSSAAAAFLSSFVDEDVPWIHIDAAGVLDNDEGGTGWGVALLSDFIYNVE